MYKFDPTNKLLKIQQIPEADLELSLTGFQQESYEKFCNVTVYERLYQFLEKYGETINHKVTVYAPPIVDTVEETIGNTEAVVRSQMRPHNFYVGHTPDSTWQREIRVMPDRSISVYANLDIDGARYSRVEVFRLPEMDADGILNINGERRVCSMRLTAADGVSFDGETLGISIPTRNISIRLTDKDVKVKTPKQAISLVDIAYMYAAKEGFTGSINDTLCSAYIKSIIAKQPNVSYQAVESRLASTRLYDTYHTEAYRLGKTARDSINRALSLDRAIGYTLSRDALDYHGNPIPGLSAGKRLSAEDIALAKKNLCNSLYVEATPDVVGYKTLKSQFIISYIPAGTVIPEVVRPYLPVSVRDMPSARKDIRFRTDYEKDREDADCLYLKCDPIVLPAGNTPLTAGALEILAADPTVNKITVSNSAQRWFDVTFEEEIVGNYTIQYRDFYGTKTPEGHSAEDWVCFFNNPDLDPTDEQDDFMRFGDWLGLLSLVAYVRKHPDEHKLVNKDMGMLKRIQGPNELFDMAFDTVFNSIFRMKKAAWTQQVNNPNSVMPPDLHDLYVSWRKTIWDKNMITAASFQNPLIHTQQANLIDSGAGLKEPPDAMRMLSTGFYGRIDPYETPSGKRLGLVNTAAIGCRIDVDTGIMYTKYLRVLKERKNGEVVSCHIDPNVFVELDAQQETQYSIGDKLALEYTDAKGSYFKNSKVVARTPDGRGGHTIETMDSWDLDFVNYHSLQSLSVTDALVPFVGANEAARLTLGSGMLKQSILVQFNDKPRIFTSMYRQMFNHSTTYCCRAKRAGIVLDVCATFISVTHPSEEYLAHVPFGSTLTKSQLRDLPKNAAVWNDNNDMYNVRATTITRQSINIINYKVKPGDWVQEGDILYEATVSKDGIYSPGCNFFASYIPNGYNYEDAVEISEGAASRFTSLTVETRSITLPYHPTTSPIIEANVGRYLREGDPMVDFIIEYKGHDIPKSYDAGMHAGYLLDVVHDPSETNGRSKYLAYIIAFNKLRTGDKLIGRHSNKGTASIVRPNSEMPRFMNGVPVDVNLNPMGVPSRLNIGQNYEGYLGFIAYLLDIYIESDSFNSATKADIRTLMHYVWECCNAGVNAANAMFPQIPAELKAQALSRQEELSRWAGCFNKDGTAYLINPVSGKPYATPVTFGMPYMLKLEHEVTRKVKSRAGELDNEEYSLIHQQPVEGAVRGGGERVGEMEMVALAAYGTNELIRETINEDSDNIVERVYSAMEDVGVDDVRPRTPGAIFTRARAVPQSVEYLRYMLEVMGIDLDSELLPSPDIASSSMRVVPDKRSYTRTNAEDPVKEDEATNGYFERLKEKSLHHES